MAFDFSVPHRVRSLTDCHNVADFRALAHRRLPYPVFHYIDGAGDDEVTKARNTAAFDDVDLVPNVLAGVAEIDTSATIMGRKTSLPLMLSPTALQRLFHWHGERAVARVAERHNLWFGISSLSSVSIEEIGANYAGPKMLQYYYHKDRGLNAALVERAKAANFDAIALTVDTIVSGNRERCKRTGFTTPPRFTPSSFMSYATKPAWALNFLFRERFSLPNLETHVAEGSGKAISIQDYFNEMLDPDMDWAAVERLRADWGGKFCLKGVMSTTDARRAADIGCDAIMVSNHGGRQLDGSRAPFDQLEEIVDAVGDRIEVICDGGVRRGTHVLKALALGATAASGGRLYLYALAAAGEDGVERAVTIVRDEIARGMRLMGVKSVAELNRDVLRRR
ncbi:alpha-hydroxy acid oxidase [Tsuneonella amylolytica]|uniref:alpha-hydroxy acid oxidase n=1 Tax=Tsuneonella amylolytica TaxID=2338327 RepID=UPI000EA9C8FD|nr:alpha-hydroxy acid oxidase [Tsuneonella amylolytica]